MNFVTMEFPSETSTEPSAWAELVVRLIEVALIYAVFHYAVKICKTVYGFVTSANKLAVTLLNIHDHSDHIKSCFDHLEKFEKCKIEHQATTAVDSSHAPDTPIVTEEAFEALPDSPAKEQGAHQEEEQQQEASTASTESRFIQHPPQAQPTTLNTGHHSPAPSYSLSSSQSTSSSSSRLGTFRISATVWTQQNNLHHQGKSFSFRSCVTGSQTYKKKQRVLNQIVEQIGTNDFWACIPMDHDTKAHCDPIDTGLPYLEHVLRCVRVMKERRR